MFGGDEDQLKAAKLITTSPVVVLSGRGGCGKTHVVSTVLAKALKLKRSQITAESCVKQNECSVAENSQRSFDASQNVSQSNSKPPVTPWCSASETQVKEENFSQNAEIPQRQSKKIDPCGDSVLLTAPTGVGEIRGYWLIPQRPLISTKNSFFPIFFCSNQQKENHSPKNPILRMRSSTTFPC